MTSDQWGMLSSLLLMVVTVASITLTYRKSRKKAEAQSIRRPPPVTLSRTVTVPSSGVTYGAASGSNDGDGAEPVDDPGTPDPMQFQKDLDSQSPDRMAALNEIYRGQWLNWRVIFKERRAVPEQTTLMLRFLEENTIINITCEIDVNQFPHTENWRTNEPVRVSGTIEDISDAGIRLVDVDFEQI